jgi:hypothetical protein
MNRRRFITVVFGVISGSALPLIIPAAKKIRRSSGWMLSLKDRL